MNKDKTLITYFASLLRERLLRNVHTTEDAIRYTFFHALLSRGGYSHLDISLEEPLPSHVGRLLDMVAYDRGKRRKLVAEFKYHRERLTRRPLTQMAASVYCDLFRLAFAEAIWGSRAYLVWVTDQGMIRYFSNRRNGVSELINLGLGEKLQIGAQNVANRPTSFVSSLHGFSNPAFVTCVYNNSLTATANLRVFSVTHKPDSVYGLPKI